MSQESNTVLSQASGPAGEGAGVPGAADGFASILPEGFPVEEVDHALLGRFKQFCGTAGLSAEQAASAVGFYLAEQDGLAEHMRQSCEAQLRERWGARYDERISRAGRACLALDKRMDGRLSPLISAGLGNHPVFAELMAEVGRSLAEDTVGAAAGAPAPKAPMSTEEYLRRVVFKNR